MKTYHRYADRKWERKRDPDGDGCHPLTTCVRGRRSVATRAHALFAIVAQIDDVFTMALHWAFSICLSRARRAQWRTGSPAATKGPSAASRVCAWFAISDRGHACNGRPAGRDRKGVPSTCANARPPERRCVPAPAERAEPALRRSRNSRACGTPLRCIHVRVRPAKAPASSNVCASRDFGRSGLRISLRLSADSDCRTSYALLHHLHDRLTCAAAAWGSRWPRR